MSFPIRLAILGAGNRGSRYATYAHERPDLVRVVAVAEPRPFFREQLASEHDIAPDGVFTDWQAFLAAPRMADAVVIATQDAEHLEPAVACARQGYHILLEKPLAPGAEECAAIVEAAIAGGGIFAVCHVLRYTAYTTRLKELLDSGRIGDIVSVQHLEPIGFWHFAHSYVRGNWRNEALSSPILLAKSCHDLDWLRSIIGRSCTHVSSFGSLHHFRPEQRPAGAADRCVACSVEADCPFSALRIYGEHVRQGNTGWPINVITTDPTEAGVRRALEDGPYGRCVYACDNDVPDHQVVAMQFAGGVTATFTLTAFTDMRDRETRIFGTRGELTGNGRTISIYDFLTRQTETIAVAPGSDGSILSGHGGGDRALIAAFVDAVGHNDPSRIRSGPLETLETHLSVFAAEQARNTMQVVELRQPYLASGDV